MGCENCTDSNAQALGMLKTTVEAAQKATYYASVAAKSAAIAAAASWVIAAINIVQVLV